jgi:tRNA threonylcarbamoyl adenosine modification protein YjeE
MNYDNLSQGNLEAVAMALANNLCNGDVLLLHGTLGMGKTTFARALIRALVAQPDLGVTSPTYVLVNHYDVMAPHTAGKTAGKVSMINHYDLYRLSNLGAEDEILELGWDDSLANGVTIVEWPDRLGGLTPRDHLAVSIAPHPAIAEHRRLHIRLNGPTWQGRDLGLPVF